MARKDKRLNRKKVEQAKCDVKQNCNISDLTDSVEFADEPFNNDNKQKKSFNNRNKRGGGGC